MFYNKVHPPSSLSVHPLTPRNHTLTKVMTEVPHHKLLGAEVNSEKTIIELLERIELTQLTLRQQAYFETARRLLAILVNEELVQATLQSFNNTQWLCIHGDSQIEDRTRLYVALCEPWVDITSGILDPQDLVPPVIVETATGARKIELDPTVIFNLVYPWFGEDEKVRDRLILQIENSTQNQGL